MPDSKRAMDTAAHPKVVNLAQRREEMDEFVMNMNLSPRMMRRTDKPTIIDRGEWLNLYHQAYPEAKPERSETRPSLAGLLRLLNKTL